MIDDAKPLESEDQEPSVTPTPAAEPAAESGGEEAAPVAAEETEVAGAEPASEVESAEPVETVSEAAPEASEPEPAPAPVEERPSNLHWYTIRVQSNKEDTVRRALQNNIELRGLGRKITQVVVPTEKIAEIKRGKKRTRKVKTYPGYVLLEMVMDDETWSFVRETSGVGDFVGGSGGDHQKPFPLRPEEVAKIFGQDLPGEAEPPKVQLDFGIGDKVKITEGPFENFDGVVEEVNEQKGLIRVVVTIFGRATPVELQYWQVETI